MYEILRFAQNDKDLVYQREGGGGWWPSHQPPLPSKTQMAVILSETKCSEESHANFKNYQFSSVTIYCNTTNIYCKTITSRPDGL